MLTLSSASRKFFNHYTFFNGVNYKKYCHYQVKTHFSFSSAAQQEIHRLHKQCLQSRLVEQLYRGTLPQSTLLRFLQLDHYYLDNVYQLLDKNIHHDPDYIQVRKRLRQGFYHERNRVEKLLQHYDNGITPDIYHIDYQSCNNYLAHIAQYQHCDPVFALTALQPCEDVYYNFACKLRSLAMVTNHPYPQVLLAYQRNNTRIIGNYLTEKENLLSEAELTQIAEVYITSIKHEKMFMEAPFLSPYQETDEHDYRPNYNS